MNLFAKKAEKEELNKIKELRKSIKKKKKERKPKKKISEYIEKAGIYIEYGKIKKLVFNACVVINLIISGYLIYYFSIHSEYNLIYLSITMAFLWLLAFFALIFFMWLVFYITIDFKIFQRKVGIEDVLPDFLQLTSANIRAGMPIDQALWHAIRPNFGVLAKEMEDVAKQTMAGTDLETALYGFAAKYDSKLLKRSMSLLIEGLNAGGEIGELLDRISENIQDAKLMQKEMSASVTTYAIFIGFASIVAAPFLLALSKQLLTVISKIISSISLPKTGMKMMISFSQVSVTPSDFMIFALVTLTITSLLSACIIAIIKKGNIRAGIRYIPAFLISTLLLFFIMDKIMSISMAGIF